MYEKTDNYFLAAAFFSILLSIALWFGVGYLHGLFVGLWVPSILALWVGFNATHILDSLSRR